MACGEAPYLCSRYDATTGDLIPVLRRIGLLDRKLLLVNANTSGITSDMNAQQRKYTQKYGGELHIGHFNLLMVLSGKVTIFFLQESLYLLPSLSITKRNGM